MSPDAAGPRIVETDIPSRLDALPWGRFHTLVVTALGITWILDGLEVTLAGAVSGALKASPALRMSDAQVGLAASAYLCGAVLGALFFGYLTDRLGRKRLFSVTLGLYLFATAATALAPNFWAFAFFRFLTGAGIGGEYSAINSAIQELIPARYRGHTDLVINGSFWIGAALGAIGAVVLLDPALLPEDLGWRVCFGLGAVLGLAILYLRRFLPESPRWLMVHGRLAEAEAVVSEIEGRTVGTAAGGALRYARCAGYSGQASAPTDQRWTIRLQLRDHPVNFVDLARTLFRTYPQRATLGLVLMASQAFFYNAIFFTYALVLGKFFGVLPEHIGLYLLPLAAGNFLGPLLLGRLFDTIGRRQMIAFTYVTAGVSLAISTVLFLNGVYDARGQAIAWSIVFFFASAAASSGYLTIGECFPLELRALTIALFYALGTAIGGVAGPVVFGTLIGTGERELIAGGYWFGAALMVGAGIVAWRLGVKAERTSLERVAAPICALRPQEGPRQLRMPPSM
jgi:MFS family permease